MLRRVFFAALFCSLTALAAALPWDKPPEQWTEADLFRILRDSPWSPAKLSLESDYRQRRSDPQSGAVTDSPGQVQGGIVRGMVVSRGHPLPAVTVLWWSSRMIRLAESKLLETRAAAAAKEKIDTAESPDVVLAVLGDEPLRILRGAEGDLHDSVFLELENGGTLDFTSVNYVDETDAETLRSEFHFPRLLNGVPAVDPDSERVIFHCRAVAKKEIPGRSNSLSFRVEFNARAMRAQGHPDL